MWNRYLLAYWHSNQEIVHIFSILRFLGSPSPATNSFYAINTIYKPPLDASREWKGMCLFTSTDLKSPTLLYLKSAEKPTVTPQSRASPPNHDSPSAPQNGQRSNDLCWLSAGHLLKTNPSPTRVPCGGGKLPHLLVSCTVLGWIFIF